jgi:hypothetical protein
VDYEAGIYLTSATPAVIFVNGREQKLSNQDIITLLRSLPPGSIERIEVMRTPSTKYDAASSGGIINIVLKKGMKIGKFGSANIGMNQGKYGNRFGGFSLNNSGDKTNYYVNANFNRNDFQEDLNSHRELSPDTFLHQSAISRQPANMGFLGYGIAYDISDSLVFSYDGRIGLSDKNTRSESLGNIGSEGSQTMASTSDLSESKYLSWNISQDLGLFRSLDTNGSSWDTKLSYNITTGDNEQNYLTTVSLPFPFSIEGEGNNLQTRHFALMQSDLTLKLPAKISFETGVKTTYQLFGSDAEYFFLNGGQATNDSDRTSAFTYRESISAFYAQASKEIWAEITLKAGFRLEHTYMNGLQTIPTDTSFLVNRIDWFPYVYLSRKLFSMFGIELRTYLIYRRTISRPDYQNLNPYERYIDPFLYEAGNPELTPQFTDNVEFNVSFEDMPVFALGRNYTTDMFSSVVYRDDENPNIAVMTWDNLGKNTETYFRGMAGIPPGGAYFFALGAQYNLNDYDGYYQGEKLTYERGSWRFFTFHSLTLFKNTRITASGFMMMKGQQGFYELNDFGALNFGITQTLLNKSLTITLSARDVLRTMVTEFSIDQGGIKTSGDRYSDNRRFGINIRYNFGVGTRSKKGPEGFDQEGYDAPE